MSAATPGPTASLHLSSRSPPPFLKARVPTISRNLSGQTVGETQIGATTAAIRPMTSPRRAKEAVVRTRRPIPMPTARTTVPTRGVAEPAEPVVDDRRPREPTEILRMTASTTP